MFKVERKDTKVAVVDTTRTTNKAIYFADESEYIEVDGDLKQVKHAKDKEIIQAVLAAGLDKK